MKSIEITRLKEEIMAERQNDGKNVETFQEAQEERFGDLAHKFALA